MNNTDAIRKIEGKETTNSPVGLWIGGDFKANNPDGNVWDTLGGK